MIVGGRLKEKRDESEEEMTDEDKIKRRKGSRRRTSQVSR